jgi:hypothetical protein
MPTAHAADFPMVLLVRRTLTKERCLFGSARSQEIVRKPADLSVFAKKGQLRHTGLSV